MIWSLHGESFQAALDNGSCSFVFSLDTGHTESASQENAKGMSEEKDINAGDENTSARDASNGAVSSFHCNTIGSG